MNNDEILIIQNYLRDIFDNEDISVRKDQDVPPTASIFISSEACLLYTSPSPRDGLLSRMPSSA